MKATKQKNQNFHEQSIRHSALGVHFLCLPSPKNLSGMKTSKRKMSQLIDT